jgi:hypothetical protein
MPQSTVLSYEIWFNIYSGYIEVGYWDAIIILKVSIATFKDDEGGYLFGGTKVKMSSEYVDYLEIIHDFLLIDISAVICKNIKYKMQGFENPAFLKRFFDVN